MPKILAVDDDPDILRLVEIKLKKAGFQVLLARDGEEGLQTALAEKPDVVLLDGMMPKMDGYSAARRIKTEISPAPIVIMLTAKGQEADVTHGIQEGADDYIVKPFAPNELIARINIALTNRAKPSSTVPAA